MAATVTNQLPLYMEHYHKNIAEIFFTSKKLTSPVLAGMESRSEDDGGGRGFINRTIHRLTGAVASTFARAQTKARGATTGSTFGSDRWTSQALRVDAVATFAQDNILAAKGDSSKILDIIKASMESATLAIRKRVNLHSVNAGWGKIATVTAVSSTTVTIDPVLCNRLQEGDTIVACASESGAVIRNITGTDEVGITNIARSTGVLTVDTDVTAGTAWAVGDIIFMAGDREDSATPTRLVMTGLNGWFGTDTTLHGITRTGKADLIALQVDGVAKDYGSASVEGLRQLYSYDSYASVQYVAPGDFEQIAMDKDATKIVQIEMGKFKHGFEGVMASYSGYSVPILPDALMEPNISFMGPFDDAEVAPYLAHNGDLVNVSDEDGKQIRFVDGTNDLEARLYNRGAIICPGPGKFARITSFGL